MGSRKEGGGSAQKAEAAAKSADKVYPVRIIRVNIPMGSSAVLFPPICQVVDVQEAMKPAKDAKTTLGERFSGPCHCASAPVRQTRRFYPVGLMQYAEPACDCMQVAEVTEAVKEAKDAKKEVAVELEKGADTVVCSSSS